MIFIDRYREDENGKPIRPSDSWFSKANKATEVAKLEKTKHKWDRGIYADVREVRPALEKLFHDKCAYCERALPGDWDVEHFRPKGRLAEREDPPGYYWLGYEWENLYPSCTHCNQLRKDKPRWGDRRTLPSGGKLVQFPVVDEKTRAMGPDNDIYREHTLLIDPCYDDPEWYLGYELNGQIFALDGNPYGDKTIEVFHLKRRRLRDARKKTIEWVIRFLRKIKKAESRGNDEAVKDFKELLQILLEESSKYVGAARFIENNFSSFLGEDS